MSAAPRRWLEVSVRLPEDADAGAVLAEALLGLGCRAVEERAGRLIGHLPEGATDARDAEAVRARLARAGVVVPRDVTVGWREHEDWSEAWRRGLGPRRVGRRLIVTPSWESPDDVGTDDLVIAIDPGVAFGTAEHGTTRGCLRLLEDAASPGARIIDVGAGSGVLSIAAAKLRADRVVALESDALAFDTLLANVEANGAGDVVVCRPDHADPSLMRALGPVDGVMANLTTGVLRELTPGFAAALRGAGWLIASGVPEGEWRDVERALEERGFAVSRVDRDEGWCTGLAHLSE